jgi:hypothetical protein
VVTNDAGGVDHEHLRRRRGAVLTSRGLVCVPEVQPGHLAALHPRRHPLEGVERLDDVVVADHLDHRHAAVGVLARHVLDAVVPRERVRAAVGREDDDGGAVLGRIDGRRPAVDVGQGQAGRGVPDSEAGGLSHVRQSGPRQIRTAVLIGDAAHRSA